MMVYIRICVVRKCISEYIRVFYHYNLYLCMHIYCFSPCAERGQLAVGASSDFAVAADRMDD
jgi:hypothetical protein